MKAIRRIDNKEWVADITNVTGTIHTGTIPKLLHEDVTLAHIEQAYKPFEVDLSSYELVEVEVLEVKELNKLRNRVEVKNLLLQAMENQIESYKQHIELLQTLVKQLQD